MKSIKKEIGEALKIFGLILILSVLFFPQFQDAFIPIESKKLHGAFIPASPPSFSWKSWRFGAYQDSLRRNIEDSLPLRAELIRLNNQIDYSLFKIPHGEKVVIGKNDNLFFTEYIDGYLGNGFQKKAIIDDKIQKFKRIQDILWKRNKIFLLLVIPPDKGTFSAEDIPDFYLKNPRDTSMRPYMMRQLQANKIHVIDFLPVFLNQKKSSPYPLMPKTGVHWSNYGSYLAADSMFRYITAFSGYRFPEMKLARLEESSIPRDEDGDIDNLLNLIWPTSESILAYPVIRYQSDTGFQKPKALFIGDSFYWELYYQGIINNMFANQEFWYYDNTVFPESFSEKKNTASVKLMDAIDRQNIIVIIQVGAGWGNPGFGFIDRLYAAIDTSSGNRILEIERDILNNPEWYELIKNKAKFENVPVERKLRSEAIYVYNQQLIKTK